MNDLERWKERRESLIGQIEMLRSGGLKTHDGPSLVENDTTAQSLADAEAYLAEAEEFIARLEAPDA